jgi:hypothetical protein
MLSLRRLESVTTGIGRNTLAALTVGILLGGCATTGPPPGAQAATCASGATVPVLESVTFHTTMERYETVYPEFHFHDDSGTVRFIHRELVVTSDAGFNNINPDSIIRIPAQLQRQGTVFVGGWGCGPGSYYVTLRAFLINLQGGKSNTLEYTIHCNGG